MLGAQIGRRPRAVALGQAAPQEWLMGSLEVQGEALAGRRRRTGSFGPERPRSRRGHRPNLTLPGNRTRSQIDLRDVSAKLAVHAAVSGRTAAGLANLPGRSLRFTDLGGRPLRRTSSAPARSPSTWAFSATRMAQGSPLWAPGIWPSPHRARGSCTSAGGSRRFRTLRLRTARSWARPHSWICIRSAWGEPAHAAGDKRRSISDAADR
jgi:hypothetical protein